MENVFTLVKSFKSGKRERIGEYATASEAYNAMVFHYKGNVKRGNFIYTIAEEGQKIIGGVKFRMFVSGNYLKNYNKDELSTM